MVIVLIGIGSGTSARLGRLYYVGTARTPAHDNPRHRRHGAHAGSRHSRLRRHCAGQRARHVQAARGGTAPEGGREPPRGRRRRRNQESAGGREDVPGGRRFHIVLHGPRPGALPEGGRHRCQGLRLRRGDPHSGGQPLHRPHRDRKGPVRLRRPRPAVRLRRQHPGDSFRRRQVQDLRGDPGHRGREHARQAGQGPRHGVLRRARVREARQGREGIPRAAVLREGHGRVLLRHDDRRAGTSQERGPAGGHSAVRAGDRIRHAHRGDGEGDGPHREGPGPARRGRGPEHAPEGDGRRDGPRARGGDVRPRPQVLHGQWGHDSMARQRDDKVRRSYGDIRNGGEPEIQDR